MELCILFSATFKVFSPQYFILSARSRALLRASTKQYVILIYCLENPPMESCVTLHVFTQKHYQLTEATFLLICILLPRTSREKCALPSSELLCNLHLMLRLLKLRLTCNHSCQGMTSSVHRIVHGKGGKASWGILLISWFFYTAIYYPHSIKSLLLLSHCTFWRKVKKEKMLKISVVEIFLSLCS